MREKNFSDNGKSYVRISKAEARKRASNGDKILVCACNLRPLGVWGLGAWVCSDFDMQVNAYEFYNCINNETGRYASFYKEEI